MGVSTSVAVHLQQDGHDAVHLRAIAAPNTPDPAIVQIAAEQSRVIITCDLDFPELLIRSRARGPSLIVLRIANLRADNIVRRLATVLSQVDRVLLDGAIVVVEDARARVRPLPIAP